MPRMCGTPIAQSLAEPVQLPARRLGICVSEQKGLEKAIPHA